MDRRIFLELATAAGIANILGFQETKAAPPDLKKAWLEVCDYVASGNTVAGGVLTTTAIQFACSTLEANGITVDRAIVHPVLLPQIRELRAFTIMEDANGSMELYMHSYKTQSCAYDEKAKAFGPTETIETPERYISLSPNENFPENVMLLIKKGEAKMAKVTIHQGY